MARILPVIQCEINLAANPVQEVCQIISEITPYHPGQEKAILIGIRAAIDKRLAQLPKGGTDDHGKSLRESSRL